MQTWLDYRLAWNVSDFDGLDVIYIPVTKIWIPDVLLKNRSQPYRRVHGDTGRERCCNCCMFYGQFFVCLTITLFLFLRVLYWSFCTVVRHAEGIMCETPDRKR